MPRGKGKGSGHKGQRRHFTNPDELEAQKEKADRERIWREQHGGIGSDNDEKEEEKSSSEEDEEEEEDDEGEAKAKGVQHLIEVSNPNRAAIKAKKTPLLEEAGDNNEAPQLSRREREELERQKAKAHYMKLHAAGKTEQARQDMARLAIIRKQREDAARKREEEKKVKPRNRKEQ